MEGNTIVCHLQKELVALIPLVGMKNFTKMEKVFKCLKRKKLCEEERFYNLEDDSYYLDDSYKLGYFLMIQNEREVEVFIAPIIQNISNILILNLDNSNIISRFFILII